MSLNYYVIENYYKIWNNLFNEINNLVYFYTNDDNLIFHQCLFEEHFNKFLFESNYIFKSSIHYLCKMNTPEKFKKNIECPICLKEIKNSCLFSMTKCNHAFHTNCLYESLCKVNLNCPICRCNLCNCIVCEKNQI